jgi:hypothetical protein
MPLCINCQYRHLYRISFSPEKYFRAALPSWHAWLWLRIRKALKLLSEFRIGRVYDFLILFYALRWLLRRPFLIAIERFDNGISQTLYLYLVIHLQVGKPSGQLRARHLLQEILNVPIAKPLSEPISVIERPNF